MSKFILDQNYRFKFIEDEDSIFKDEFDVLLDKIIKMYESSRISKKELKIFLKFILNSQLKKEIKEEELRLKKYFVEKEKRTDTIFINFINRNIYG